MAKYIENLATPEEQELERIRRECREKSMLDPMYRGDKVYTPYFHNLVLLSALPENANVPKPYCAHPCEGHWIFTISNHDRMIFKELTNIKKIGLYVDYDLEMAWCENYV